MLRLIAALLLCTFSLCASAQNLFFGAHIAAGIAPGKAGVGIRAGVGFKKLDVILNTSTSLLGGTSGNYFQIAEAQLHYKISRSIYAGATAGYNVLMADTYYAEGIHAGAILGTSSRLGKLKKWRYYFEAAPKLCFDNVDDFNSRLGMGYYTNSGTATKFILLFNAGIA